MVIWIIDRYDPRAVDIRVVIQGVEIELIVQTRVDKLYAIHYGSVICKIEPGESVFYISAPKLIVVGFPTVNALLVIVTEVKFPADIAGEAMIPFYT